LRGNTVWQVQQLYRQVNAIGLSKHQAKQAARSSGARTHAEVARQTGIHSFATANAYRDVWEAIGRHAKAKYGVKDMERLTGQHVSSFLETKINDGVSRATFDQYAAAASKLETALNKFAQDRTGIYYNFELKDVRALGAQELGGRNHESRAYPATARILSSLDGQNLLAAKIQAEGGGRVKEVSQIREGQLRGLHRDSLAGQQRGHVEVIGKGGKERIIQISPATYAELKAVVLGGQMFRLNNYKGYLASLKQAAGQSKQAYTGSHGLRWGFAQERMGELQRIGLTYEESLRQVSQEMGHERSDITEHYLK
jgi:integrase